MNLYLDCEFNEYRGELISMALVAASGDEWYESIGCASPKSWVREHVMPIIGKTSVSLDVLQASLECFLGEYEAVHIVTDWPEDVAHFCQALITGPGTRLNTPPLTFEVLRIDGVSELPHNALADARGLRKAVEAFA